MTDAGQQPLMSQRGALLKLLQVSIAPETSGGSLPRAVMTTLWPTSPTIPSAALHSINRLSIATWGREHRTQTPRYRLIAVGSRRSLHPDPHQPIHLEYRAPHAALVKATRFAGGFSAGLDQRTGRAGVNASAPRGMAGETGAHRTLSTPTRSRRFSIGATLHRPRPYHGVATASGRSPTTPHHRSLGEPRYCSTPQVSLTARRQTRVAEATRVFTGG